MRSPCLEGTPGAGFFLAALSLGCGASLLWFQYAAASLAVGARALEGL